MHALEFNDEDVSEAVIALGVLCTKAFKADIFEVKGRRSLRHFDDVQCCRVEPWLCEDEFLDLRMCFPSVFDSVCVDFDDVVVIEVLTPAEETMNDAGNTAADAILNAWFKYVLAVCDTPREDFQLKNLTGGYLVFECLFVFVQLFTCTSLRYAHVR